MASANVFQSLIRPPRSISEYAADMDRAEANQIQMAAARRQMQEADRATQEQNALRELLNSGLDFSTPEGQAKLYATSPKMASDLLKSRSEMLKNEATTARERATTQKTTQDMEREKLNSSVMEFVSLSNPQEAMAAFERKVQAGEFPATALEGMRAQLGSLKTPEEFKSWQLRAVLSRLGVKDAMTAMQPKMGAPMDSGTAVTVPFYEPMTGRPIQGAGMAVQKSPTELQQAQAAESRARAAYEFNAGGGQAAPSAPVPQGGQTAPTSPSPVSQAPRSTGATIDVNNPGGLRPVGASTGFQQFSTPDQGIQAVTNNLRAYGQRGINTIERIVSTWAPPNENNTRAYIADVSRTLGIPPNQPLDMNNPYVLHGLTTAIMMKEQGPRLFASSAAPQPATADTSPQSGDMPQRMQGESQKDYMARVRQVQGAKARSESKQGQLPTSALKLQQEEVDAIGAASGIKADLESIKAQINNKKLDLGLVSNYISRGRNFVGLSDEQSRNYQSFVSTLERLRNESLRLNKGVQTEGDAVRAWNELITNLNDSRAVGQRLEEITRLNDRAVSLRRMNIDLIRSNFNAAPLDTSGQQNLAPTVGVAKSMTSADVDATARASGKTREQVIKDATAKGFTIK